jgi:purine nucleosidase/pyrimidine-specific ribonucleoside hydrolase
MFHKNLLMEKHNNMVQKRKLVYDCDPGTDDSVAILMALTHPSLDLLAITAESGNFPSSISALHALQILEFIGRTDVPVARGMEHPLVRPYPPDPYCHGEDGLGNHFFPGPKIKPIEQSAANCIIDLVMKFPGEVSLVCTSALTNVALAFMMRPEIIPMVQEIIHLGGAYGFSGYAFSNATGDNPMSEWNVYVDPEAAKIVYESGANLTTIGLDIAFNPHMVNISDTTIGILKTLNTPQAKYTLEIIDYIDKNNSIPDKGLLLNGPIDTTAMCCFIEPSIMAVDRIKVAVDTGGQLTRGMTIWDRRDHFRWENLAEIKTVSSLDAEAYQGVFIQALGGPGGSPIPLPGERPR